MPLPMSQGVNHGLASLSRHDNQKPLVNSDHNRRLGLLVLLLETAPIL